MSAKIILSKDFLDDFDQSIDTAIMNLTDMATIEMKKNAPFAKPSQYPNGYRGEPGTLVSSISRKGTGRNTQIVSSVPYAIRRNYENQLNPQTLHYRERSIDNILRGKQSQWWQASSN
jgi:hypothetical protein